jgi:hypothetical protein
MNISVEVLLFCTLNITLGSLGQPEALQDISLPLMVCVTLHILSSYMLQIAAITGFRSSHHMENLFMLLVHMDEQMDSFLGLLDCVCPMIASMSVTT